jgi:hypothetical protein
MSITTVISTIIIISLIAILFLIMSRLSLSFKPFSFKIQEPFRGIGWVLLVLGISCMEYSAQKKGRNEIFDKAKKTLDDIKKTQEQSDITLKESERTLNLNKEIYKKLKEKDGK